MTPLLMLFGDTISTKVATSVESSATPMAPLYVFTPLAKAVAPAAESVISSLDDDVLISPICLNRP